jgi:putative IMPACT (imprinted ancient) family translation regulator
MTLYEIDNAILACVDQETGEIIDPEALDALQMERGKKLENVALWVKDLKAEAEAIGNEIKNLTARKKTAEAKAERLKAWLGEALEGEVFKTSKVRVSYTHSTRLNVIDEQSVVNWIETNFTEPEELLRYQLPEIRKDAVKAAIKDGAEIPGACLEATESVVIK